MTNKRYKLSPRDNFYQTPLLGLKFKKTVLSESMNRPTNFFADHKDSYWFHIYTIKQKLINEIISIINFCRLRTKHTDESDSAKSKQYQDSVIK